MFNVLLRFWAEPNESSANYRRSLPDLSPHHCLVFDCYTIAIPHDAFAGHCAEFREYALPRFGTIGSVER